jgi:protein-S-isoprenylcysteine O-methyltransferase Ste14
MTGIVSAATALALFCAAFLCAGLIWSILFPERRIWPPERVTWMTQAMIWPPTLTIVACVAIVGIAEWNALGWPLGVRWGVGLPLILAGNTVVWSAVFGIGLEATSGARADLKADGLYRWSRNPEYVADMGILIGWVILSASLSAMIAATGGLIALVLAPFAEEPWLEEVHGAAYLSYRRRTPRFLGLPRQ